MHDRILKQLLKGLYIYNFLVLKLYFAFIAVVNLNLNVCKSTFRAKFDPKLNGPR